MVRVEKSPAGSAAINHLTGKAARESKGQPTAIRHWQSGLKLTKSTVKKAFTQFGVAVAGDHALALTTNLASEHYVETGDMLDGTFIKRIPLPARPLNCGIAVAKGHIYVSMIDGSVACIR